MGCLQVLPRHRSDEAVVNDHGAVASVRFASTASDPASVRQPVFEESPATKGDPEAGTKLIKWDFFTYQAIRVQRTRR